MSVEVLLGLVERSRTGDVLPVVECVVVGEVSVFHGRGRLHGSASDDAANAPEPWVPEKLFSSRDLETSFFPLTKLLPMAGLPHIALDDVSDDVAQFKVPFPMF